LFVLLFVRAAAAPVGDERPCDDLALAAAAAAIAAIVLPLLALLLFDCDNDWGCVDR
jgi:hypothetical protein